jgi:hypothetical protein
MDERKKLLKSHGAGPGTRGGRRKTLSSSRQEHNRQAPFGPAGLFQFGRSPQASISFTVRM